MSKKRSVEERLKDPQDDLPSMDELEDEFAMNMFRGLMFVGILVATILLIAKCT